LGCDLLKSIIFGGFLGEQQNSLMLLISLFEEFLMVFTI